MTWTFDLTICGHGTRLRPDTTLARRLLGWEPTVSWTEGLARTVEAFRSDAAVSA